MSNYAQLTIHSKVSKVKKLNETMGRIIKGTRLSQSGSIQKKNRQSKQKQKELIENNKKIQLNSEDVNNYDIETEQSKAKSDINFNKITEKKVNAEEKERLKTQSNFESNIFPAIYFKKTTMRNVLKQLVFSQNCKSLSPNDQKAPLIYQIVANLFSEITFFVFNILVSKDQLTQIYYAHFSDSDVVPSTKCCKTAAYVALQPNGTGKILCNNPSCPHPNLAQFLINFEDGSKIWPDMTYLNTAPEKDINMREKIIKSIYTGKFKSFRLKNLINETSKEVSETFYKTRNSSIKGEFNQFSDDAFMTSVAANNIQKQKKKSKSFYQNINSNLNQQQMLQIVSQTDKNIESLKVKLQYMVKRQKQLPKNLAKGIIDQGKVFQKRFEMNQKIDEVMRKTRHSNATTYLSFPRLMDQLISTQQKKIRSFNRISNNKDK